MAGRHSRQIPCAPTQSMHNAAVGASTARRALDSVEKDRLEYKDRLPAFRHNSLSLLPLSVLFFHPPRPPTPCLPPCTTARLRPSSDIPSPKAPVHIQMRSTPLSTSKERVSSTTSKSLTMRESLHVPSSAFPHSCFSPRSKPFPIDPDEPEETHQLTLRYANSPPDPCVPSHLIALFIQSHHCWFIARRSR